MPLLHASDECESAKKFQLRIVGDRRSKSMPDLSAADQKSPVKEPDDTQKRPKDACLRDADGRVGGLQEAKGRARRAQVLRRCKAEATEGTTIHYLLPKNLERRGLWSIWFHPGAISQS